MIENQMEIFSFLRLMQMGLSAVSSPGLNY
jgi:hypothetical protein